MLATLLCRIGRYIDALNRGQLEMTCWIVSLLPLQRRQSGLVLLSGDRFAFNAFVWSSSSCIAQINPSTCEENDDFFIHAFVCFSLISFTLDRVRKRFPCCGFSVHAFRWLSFSFFLICVARCFGLSASVVSIPKQLVSSSATLTRQLFSCFSTAAKNTLLLDCSLRC